MAQALRICPGLIVTPPRFRAYGAMSRRVMDRAYRLTPLVEQISIDEAFLDVTARVEPPEMLALGLQAEIRRDLGLPCSLGVATNKLVAKIANNTGKSNATGDGPPSAVTAVPAGKEAAFLAPLACDELWGVGPKTATRLAELGLLTIGELAVASPDLLEIHFGKHGRELAVRAQGIDDRPVETEHEAKSISQETTFAHDIADAAYLLATLAELAAGVSKDLRRKGLAGTTVKLKLRWPDFTTPTRQLTLEAPTDDAHHILAAARRLFERLWEPGRAVRLLGIGVSGFSDAPRQMGLWDAPDERLERLHRTVVAVRARFGDQAILSGRDVAQLKRPRPYKALPSED
jgi:DNA polymerase-4